MKGIVNSLVEIQGKYNTAKVFTEKLDANAAGQIETLCSQAFTAGSRIRIMPDVHAGMGCTIGTTMTIQDKAVPNLVGVDIGCGMETVRLKQKRLELPKLDQLIQKQIPSGFEIREKPHRYLDEIDLTALRCFKYVNMDRASRSMGTLGGGNHFIEADRDEEGNLYLVIHSGSRHLGLEVAKYYQDAGYKQQNQKGEKEIEALITQYKAEGREKEIQTALNSLKEQTVSDIPYPLAYVSGALFDNYIHDMKLVQQYAVLNRQAMMDIIIKGMKLDIEECFSTIHNYIDTDRMILRKGAVSAQKGEKLLIPINMRDGSLICLGKGEVDWNFSAPHGAGRLMSRAEAKQSFTVSEFKKQMEGIYTSSVNKGTLDECPMAYKDMSDIVANIGPTAEIIKTIRPVYNFKAGEEEPSAKRKRR